jgi:hypothetical protein
MRPSAFTHLHTAGKEEKERRLRDFIARDLETRKADTASTGATVYRLLALSLESPAAQALSALAADIAEQGITIEMVFLRKVSAADAEQAIPGVACRIANDRRLFDAHEQLVLGTESVWTGDCMRREPTRRDSYESYRPNCGKTVGWASSSFERIWMKAKPAGSGSTMKTPAETPEQALLEASLMASPDATPHPVALRH